MWKLAVMKEVTVVEDGGSDGQEKNKERGMLEWGGGDDGIVVS